MNQSPATGDAAYDTGSLAGLCRRVLRPIIGILMRSGMPYAQFADIARSTYVEIASEEFGIKGRRTNTSRIALLTGLSRVQSKRELDRLPSGGARRRRDGPDKVRHISRVLLGWHADPRFLDEQGRPRPLPLTGEGISFQTLYDEFSGKVVPATSMLKELVHVGAVEKTANGRLIPRARSYMPKRSDRAALQRAFLALSDLAGGVRHNLFRKRDERTRFECLATNQRIPESRLDEFRDFLDVEGAAFLGRTENWLAQREVSEGDRELVRVGVGVYEVCTSPVTSPDE